MEKATIFGDYEVDVLTDENGGKYFIVDYATGERHPLKLVDGKYVPDLPKGGSRRFARKSRSRRARRSRSRSSKSLQSFRR